MNIKIKQIPLIKLPQYAQIPISFKVQSIFKAINVNNGLNGIKLEEEKIVDPYIKDSDSYEDGGPENWPKRFNIANWGIFIAYDNDKQVGGVTVAYKTPNVHMLNNREDLAVLWDLRIHPEFRRMGIGLRLLNHSIEWSRNKECKQLKIETQNINVPACKLYTKKGCHLGEINQYGYYGQPKVSNEVMLVWYYELKKRNKIESNSK